MTAEAPTPQPDLVGRTVGGRFKVLEKLAAGGMGVVYKAEQVPLGRMVAVKILRHPQDPRLDDNFSKRFLLEAAAVANLNHPHTVVVHDYGRDGELLYFAMEYLPGSTLTGLVKKGGPMHPSHAIHVAMQIASSLLDAHGQDLVHRDLKPGNVMVGERGGDPLFAKVLDFGLVKMVSKQENVKLTQSGIMLGSPRYMSPEQVRGGEVDHRADIYAFGAVLCFMLTGKSPFASGSQFEAMRAHVYTPAPKLREVNPECRASERVEQVVLRCLEKKPDDRFQSFAEIISALEHARLAPTDDEFDAKPTMMRDSGVSPIAAPLSQPPAESVPPAPTPTPGPAPQFSLEARMSANPPAPSDPPAPEPSADVPSMRDAAVRRTLTWVLRGLIILVVVAAAGLAAFIIPNAASEPEMQSTPLPPLPVEPAPTPQPEPVPEPAPEVAPPQPAAARTTIVEVHSDPSPAVVRRGGGDIGDTPVTLEIPEGETWIIEVSATGYVPQQVELRGGDGRRDVVLERRRRRPPRVPEEGMGMEPTETRMDPGSRMDDPFWNPWGAEE
ncbi:MAG: serine/threonine-protein kinase [Myxococcota bacterium]